MSGTLDLQRQLFDILLRLERLEKTELASISETFTPTYFGSTSAGVTTYSLQTGNKLRSTSLVVITGEVTWTAVTGTGNARVGMPGDMAPSADSVGVLYLNGVTFAASAPSAIIQQAGGGQLRLFSYTTNAAPTEVAIEAAGDIRFAIAYFIS